MKFINPKEDFEKSISNPRPMEVLSHPECVYMTKTESCCVSFGEDTCGGWMKLHRVTVWRKWKQMPIIFLVMKAEFLQPFIMSDVMTALAPLVDNASAYQIMKALGRVVKAYGGSIPAERINVISDIIRKPKEELTREERSSVVWNLKNLLDGEPYKNCEVCIVSPQNAAQRYKRGRKLRKCDRIPTSV
jgi:hypothetical protein